MQPTGHPMHGLFYFLYQKQGKTDIIDLGACMRLDCLIQAQDFLMPYLYLTSLTLHDIHKCNDSSNLPPS